MTGRNRDPQQFSSVDWVKYILLSICILLIALNIALIRGYKREKAAHAKLQKEMHERRTLLEKRGKQQMALWQAEVRSWPYLETALEFGDFRQPAKVEKNLTQAIDLHSGLTIAYYLRAHVRFALDKYEQGIEDISFYLSQIPSSIHGYLLRAKLYHKMGKTAQAKSDLKEVLDKQPELEQAQQLLQDINSLSKFKE